MSEIDRWHWSGSLCLYKDGKLVDEMKHSPYLSSPSPAVVLYADHVAEVERLKRIEELALIWSAYQTDESKREQLEDVGMRILADMAEDSLYSAVADTRLPAPTTGSR
jgi:hypothetical protein